MRVLLDTDFCSLVLRGDPAAEQRLRRCHVTDVAIASVTWAEAMYGCARSVRGALLRRMWSELVVDWPILPFDARCAEAYARIRCDLERRGCVIGDRDMMIAGTAMVHDLDFVTSNLDEFQRVRGLRLEDWRVS